MATALVPVFTGTLADRTVQLCDARALHTFMQVRRDFSNWIKGRIRKFGFVAGEDYISISRSPELASGNRGASIDYHLTLDMAKELAMVENNEQGRAARRYFIECERQVQAAINATPYSVQPGQTLSTEQAEALRNLLTSHVQKLPKPQQGKAMVQGWSKLKAHFGTDYRHIPAGEFHEAVSIIARHIVDWELVDETPALPHQPTVQEIVADWVRKIEEPNGYPAMLFMPLVNAVLRKMGCTLPGSELPRLTMTVAPPPIGSYKYDRANPYPRNGRTIEVAKSIVADIRNWSDNLPAGPAKRDLHNATDTLYDLLVSGWTEVDEALGQLSTAMHYLNRWQGRGGRMGNIA